MTIIYRPAFLKTLKKADVRIRKDFKKRIGIFIKNPNDSRLNNHPLKREWEGYRSININADWRAIYREKKEGQKRIAYFFALGTHKELYQTS